jgi:hypothetical protein
VSLVLKHFFQGFFSLGVAVVVEEDLGKVELCRHVLFIRFDGLQVKFEGILEVAARVMDLTQDEIDVTAKVLNF